MSGFVLDEKFQRNASKFAIFYIYVNPKLLFCLLFHATLLFSLMNALVYDDIDQGSCTKCKTEKATSGFHMYKIWQILTRFAGIFRQAQTLKLGGVIFL